MKTGVAFPPSQELADRNLIHQQGMQLYNRAGEVLDSVARSIALECQTRFVPIENLQSSELSRIANESFMKVYNHHYQASHGKASTIQSSKTVEERVFDDIDKIIKEFEEKNKKHH